MASPSYDAPSVQLALPGNHIITSAKRSHNSKLITKKSFLSYRSRAIIEPGGEVVVKKTILVNNKYKVTLETVHQPKIDQQLVIYQPKDLKIDM